MCVPDEMRRFRSKKLIHCWSKNIIGEEEKCRRKIFHRVMFVGNTGKKGEANTNTSVFLLFQNEKKKKIVRLKINIKLLPERTENLLRHSSSMLWSSTTTKTWRNHHPNTRRGPGTHAHHPRLNIFYVFRCCSANAAHSLSSRTPPAAILTLMTAAAKKSSNH